MEILLNAATIFPYIQILKKGLWARHVRSSIHPSVRLFVLTDEWTIVN